MKIFSYYASCFPFFKDTLKCIYKGFDSNRFLNKIETKKKNNRYNLTKTFFPIIFSLVKGEILQQKSIIIITNAIQNLISN